MSDIAVNRESLIRDKCSESTNKDYCAGYIDQCIDQKIKNGDSASSFIIESSSGKKLNLKDFETCIKLAPRIASLCGAPAGYKAKTPKVIPQNDRAQKSSHRTKMPNDMLTELFLIEENEPRKSAMKLMAHEIIFQKSNSGQSCNVSPTLLSKAYVGKNNECDRLNDILKLATNLVSRYIDARKTFFSKLDELQKNPLSRPDDKRCSLNVSTSTGNVSYTFRDSQTCDAYKQARVSFDKIAKSIANQITALRKSLRKALETNFEKKDEFEE